MGQHILTVHDSMYSYSRKINGFGLQPPHTHSASSMEDMARTPICCTDLQQLFLTLEAISSQNKLVQCSKPHLGASPVHSTPGDQEYKADQYNALQT